MGGNLPPVDGPKDEPDLHIIDGGIDFSDPLKPFIKKHNHRYDCSFLIHPILHKKTAVELAYAIALRIASHEPLRRGGQHPSLPKIRKFWEWVLKTLSSGNDTKIKASIRESLSKGEMPDPADWQKLMNSFRSLALAPVEKNPFCRTDHLPSKANYLEAIRPMLAKCASRGVIPSCKINGPKGARKHQRGIKTLGDLESKKLTKNEINRLLGGILDEQLADDDNFGEERADCIKALASSGIDVANLSDAEIITEIQRVNEERLKEIRRCAEADFLKAWEAYQDGQTKIESCDLSYEMDMKAPVDDLVNGYLEGKNLGDSWGLHHPAKEIFCGEYYSCDKLPIETVLSRILTLLGKRFGHCPAFDNYSWGNPFYRICETALRQKHNIAKWVTWANNRLIMNNDTMLAAKIILLIDTGLNTEVIDKLSIDCVRITDHPSIKVVSGLKKRSRRYVEAKINISDNSHKINTIEVIERTKEMTRRLRDLLINPNPYFKVKKNGDLEESDLFIRILTSKKNKEINTVWLGNSSGVTGGAILNRFRGRHPSVDSYDFTLRSFRPTITLLNYLKGKGIDVIQADADHREVNTTGGYTAVRMVSRMAQELQIREFENDMEAIFILDIPGAAEKLGYSAADYEERLQRAERTGLGTVCDHLRKNGEGKFESIKRENCSPVNDCPGCPLSRAVPAVKETLVDALLTSSWLRKNELRLKSENLQRWWRVWARWLAIAEGVIDKARSDHRVKRSTLREAEQQAANFDAEFLPLL